MTENTHWIYLKQSGCIGIDLNTGKYSKDVTYQNLIDLFDKRYGNFRFNDYEKVVLKDKSVIEVSQVSGLMRDEHERMVELRHQKYQQFQKEKEELEKVNRKFNEKWKGFRQPF
tara:strand:+ start:167 stop:508 length:342 start_codon:yes stop_codon:yes gene_type:complete